MYVLSPSHVKFIYKKITLLFKECVLLYKLIEKQQGISSRMSAYKVYHIFPAFLAGIQKTQRQRMILNPKAELLNSKKRF